MSIRLLSEQLISHIAAGEVVERPASVLKELLENSLDAGADRLHVEVEKGGVKRIRVRDNGSGIAKEDLALAVSRHATSKILSLADLDGVTTLGFRGEALASIAAVSQLLLISRARGQESGWKLLKTAETAAHHLVPAAHPLGTLVEVRELFYNTPVRRKFLRSERTEFVRLERVVKQIALSHFDVEVQLHHNRRPLILLPRVNDQQQRQRRLGELCGQPFAENASFLERDVDGLRLWGWFGSSDCFRHQADLQYSFVNHRLVRDPLISHAVRQAYQAYQDVLYHGRHPAFVLNILLPPTQVDVNIHPSKQEIRFREPHRVHDFIVRSIKEGLAKPQHDPRGVAALPAEQNPHAGSATPADDRAGVLRAQSPNAQRLLGVQEKGVVFQRNPEAAPAFAQRLPFSTPAPAPPLGYALAQFCDSYILAENAAGLVVVDMAIAYECIAYERLRASLAHGRLGSHPLPFPVTIETSEDQVRLLDQSMPLLANFGLDISPIGPKTAVIRQIPCLLNGVDGTQLLDNVLADLAVHGNSPQLHAVLQRTLARVVGHQARLDQRKLTLIEMNSLLRDLEHSDVGFHDRGRVHTAWAQIERTELDKLFL